MGNFDASSHSITCGRISPSAMPRTSAVTALFVRQPKFHRASHKKKIYRTAVFIYSTRSGILAPSARLMLQM